MADFTQRAPGHPLLEVFPRCPALAPRLSQALCPQGALSSKGFGTDLPLVNSQVEEHNIFHNEVMAIGPHIAKEGNKVSSLAPCLLPPGLALSRAAAEGVGSPAPKLDPVPLSCSLDQVGWAPRSTLNLRAQHSISHGRFTVRLSPHPTPHTLLHHQAPTRPLISRAVLLTPTLLLLSYQEYLSDFQAKYQKLLVRDLWDPGGQSPLALVPCWDGQASPQRAHGEELWAEFCPMTLARLAPNSGSRT